MELSVFRLVPVILAAFVAGIVDAISGGGGLITLPVYLLAGVPTGLVTGTNMVSCLTGAVASLARFAKNGRVHWKTALPACPMAVLGAILGARLNLILPAEAFQAVLLAVIPMVGAVVLFRRDFGAQNCAETLSPVRQRVTALCIGLFLGAYNGFIGAGGGTFLLLAFALFLRLDLVTAAGNAKLCGGCAALAATVSYALSGAVLWPLALAAAAANALGNYIGAGLALQKGAKMIRPMFLGILCLLFLRLGAGLLT